MRRMSIKLRITLWFTTFMIVLTAALFLVLSNVSNRVAKNDVKNSLVETVEEAAAMLQEQGSLNSDYTDTLKDISVVVYDEEGNLIFGTLPDSFTENESANEEEDFYEDEKPSGSGLGFFGRNEEQHVSEVKTDTAVFYVYRMEVTVSDQKLQLQGIMSADSSFHTSEVMIHLLIYGIPVFMLLFGFGGYWLIYQAFRPINQIIKAADLIGEGQDLSKRINLTTKKQEAAVKDEIYALANSFDKMFDRLEDAFRKEKQFTSDASHELRTPTSVILSQCEFALENANTLEEAKEAIEKIMGQARKMSSLISQLLMLARAEQEGKNLSFEQINLSELTELVVESQREAMDEKKIEIVQDITPDLYVRGDETMLMRLIMNLTDNGVKYGRKDGHLKVSLKKKENEVILQVTDDGIGIAADNINRIWDRFYQVDPSRNAANNSMGLGLSMVRWITNAHHGMVTVESTLGKGTAFTVILPAIHDGDTIK